MAARKKVVEKVVEEVIKPSKIDQDSGTKFRYEFSSWDEYNKYNKEKK